MTSRYEFIIPYPVLEKYFADGRYRFQMQFGRGSFADFYGRSPEHDTIIAERRHWLAENPRRYLIALPEAQPLIEQTLAMAIGTGTVPRPGPGVPANESARFLGENWEPDYLLLTRDQAGVRLVCGCVCFPSSWSLEEKIGRPIETIHEIVPGLNASIGRPIQTFLEKLKPDDSWTRSNWGLSRSPERNQHPSRNLPRLDATVAAHEVFFRVEEQSLQVLPRTDAILFGIRIIITPLTEFLGHPAAAKLRFALETMPEPVAHYKGLSTARTRIIQLLAA